MQLKALISYDNLAGGILDEEDYHFKGLTNLKVTGEVLDNTPDKDGKVKIQFHEDFGGILEIEEHLLEFIVPSS
jgi:hypothetical protein